jgi:membrane protein
MSQDLGLRRQVRPRLGDPAVEVVDQVAVGVPRSSEQEHRPSPKELRMPDRARPRLSLSLNGLPARQLVIRTWKRMEGHDAMIWAAAIAFYALFATVPSLALFLVVTVLQLPDLSGTGGRTSGLGDLTVDQLEATLKSLFPSEAYVLVRDQIARIQSEPPVGLISVAVAVALWMVMSLSLTVIDALNRSFGVAETRSFVKLRLTALALTLLQAAVLLGSLVAIVAWPQILRALGLDPSGSVAWLATVVRWIAVFLTVLLSFGLTFNVGPAARQRWVWITPGTLAGTVAFLAFSYLFRVYVRYYGSYDRAYGSLGGIMVLLFWYWVVGMVLLAAAEMDRAIEAAAQAGESRGLVTDTSPPISNRWL